MFTLISMTLVYPYGTTQTVSEPPAAMYYHPTGTSFTVTLHNGVRFAAEPLNWVAVQGAQFKQIKDLTIADRELTVMPATSYSYSTFGSAGPTPITIQQRQAYSGIVSVSPSVAFSGLPINTLIPIQTLTHSNRCFCLTSSTDCTDGGNLIATPIVTIT